MNYLLRVMAVVLSLFSSTGFADEGARTLCVYDPLGKNGPVYQLSKDYSALMLESGFKLTLRAYIDEKIALDEFKAKQCDAIFATGNRLRPFNRVSATFEAMGAVPNQQTAGDVLNVFLHPKVATLLRSGEYEVGGLLPVGPVYLFLNDRTKSNLDDWSGQRIATLDYDKPSRALVDELGAKLVPANSASFAAKFNNRSVDAAFAPILAYQPLDLFQGLAEKGGIIKYNFAFLDFQIVFRHARFQPAFGAASRKALAGFLPRTIASVKKAEAQVDPKYWITPSKKQQELLANVLRDVRLSLRDKGVYDKTMLTLMRKIRCQQRPEAAECVERLE